MVSCWMVDGCNRSSCTYSNNSQHNGDITLLKWNPAGKRIVTGDKVIVTTLNFGVPLQLFFNKSF